MKADGANLLRFLKNADQLVVPLYQRRYSWTEEEWGQLWADILRVADDAGGADHSIGSLVQIGDIKLAGNRHNPLQVIDGQPRLTTVSLLLLALARVAERRNATASGDLDAQSIVDERIQEWYLVDERERGEKRYKLLPNEADRATYVALIDNKPLPDRGARSVVEAYRYFETQIEVSGLRLANLLLAVSRLLVVEIALDRGRDDPQLIFELGMADPALAAA